MLPEVEKSIGRQVSFNFLCHCLVARQQPTSDVNTMNEYALSWLSVVARACGRGVIHERFLVGRGEEQEKIPIQVGLFWPRFLIDSLNTRVISAFGFAKSSKHVISLTKDSLPIRNDLCLIDKAGRDQWSVIELPSARFTNLRKRQNQILQHVGEGIVLDCRRQNFIKGGRA